MQAEGQAAHAAPSEGRRARGDLDAPKAADPPRRSARGGRRRRGGDRRLYTASLGMLDRGRTILLFHARLAESEREVRRDLVARIGESGASLAVIREGFNPRDLVVRTIVTKPVRMMIRKAELRPESSLAEGLYVNFVQTLGMQE